MYSRQALSLLLAVAFQTFVNSQEQGQVPPEIEQLSAQCKQVLQSPQGSPECNPQSVMKGGAEMLTKMCQNRKRCAEENRKAIREGCAADTNSTVIKAMLGAHLELSMESACIKDSKGEYCALKAPKATSEQHAKQLMCGDCHEKLIAVMKKGAEQAQEGREQMMQAIQKMSQFCDGAGSLKKRSDQGNSTVSRTQQLSSGLSLHASFLGTFIVLVSFSAALLLPF
jgi:hypothetical protein